MKRSSGSNAANGLKRHKKNQTGLINAFIQDNLSQCSECQKHHVADCINVDFLPRIYFSLAVTLGDSNCRYLLRNDEDIVVREINDYAYKFSLDEDLIVLSLSKLAILCSNFTSDTIQELASLLSRKNLHEQRELKFIGDCLENMPSATIELIQNQVESKEYNLDTIVFSDIRMARLLPLLAMIYDNSPVIDLTALPQGNISVLKNQGSSDMEIFELDEHGNVMASPYPLSLPAPSELTMDNDAEVVDPPSSLQFPSPELLTQSFPNSQELSMTEVLSIPDYDVYTTVELKSKIKQYGFKPTNSRKKMIKDLQKIYSSIHTNSQTSVASQKRVINSDNETDTLSPAPISKTTDNETRRKIINHIKGNPTLMNKILNFESVSVDECNIGLNLTKAAMKVVLDESGVVFPQAANKKVKPSTN